MKEILVLFHLSLIGCVKKVHLPNNITLDITLPAHENKIYEIIQKWCTYNTHNNNIDITVQTADNATGTYVLHVTSKIGHTLYWNLCAHFQMIIQIKGTHLFSTFHFLESVAKQNHTQTSDTHADDTNRLQDQHYPHAILDGYGVTENTIIKTIKAIVNDLKKHIYSSIAE